MTKQEVINAVQQSAASLFTKEDVLKLVSKFDENEVDRELIEEIKDDIINELNSLEAEDILDFDTAVFDIDDDQRIVLKDVQTNLYAFEAVVDNVFDARLDY